MTATRTAPAQGGRRPSEEHGSSGALVRAFTEISDTSAEHGDLGLLLTLVATHASRLLAVSRCAVYLLDESSGLYRGHALSAGGRFDETVTRLVCGVEADHFTREIVATRRPVLISDARRDPRPIRSAMVRLNVRRVLGAPMVLRGAVIGLLFLDDAGVAHDFTDRDIALAADFANLAATIVDPTQTMARLRADVDTLARQNATLRRAVIAENRLAELVLAGANLDEIAEGVAQFTSKPCAFYTADGRRIAAGSPPGEPLPQDLLEPAELSRPELADALAGARADRPSVIGPFRDAGVPHRLLISPITTRTDGWGYLAIKEQGTRLSPFDVQVARRAATIVSLELSARHSAAEAQGTEIQALVRDLVCGFGDRDALARRAQFHGVSLDAPQVMCLISDEGRPGDDFPAAEAVITAAAGCAGRLITTVPEGVALVLGVDQSGLPDPIDAARAMAGSILAALPDAGGVLVGISDVFSGAAGFQRAYREARQVTRCLQTFGAGACGQVLAATQLGAGRLFLASTTRDEADEFVRETLGPLMDLGDRSMRDLLSTLAVFLASSRNVRWTAERVGVHENTIRYRLARIAELSGLDVATNVDHQLGGQLAILVLALEGALPEPAAERGPPEQAPADCAAGVRLTQDRPKESARVESEVPPSDSRAVRERSSVGWITSTMIPSGSRT